MDARSWKLNLFRQLMRKIRRLPEERRVQARVTCKSEFLLSKSLSKEEATKKAEKSLEYIQMLTPTKSKGKAGRYVIRDGELVLDNMGRPVMRGGVLVKQEYVINSDDMDRHVKLLRRQHFMDRH
jgi:hypothetical protein